MAEQREFPWLAAMPSPANAPEKIVAQIESDGQAIAVAMKLCAAHFSQARLAYLIGISAAYLSQMKAGVRPVPGWFVQPFCHATGSNLLAQYRQLQKALRLARAGDTERDRVEHMAAEVQRAMAA